MSATLEDTIIQRLDRGEIGTLLAHEFRGKLGELPPRKDADFLLEFPDEASPPSVEQAQSLLTATVKSWGYDVKLENSSPESFCATVFLRDTGEFRVLFAITIRRPHDGLPVCMRVTSSTA